jgi:glycosyltransferase involved in cell wall biosynthesis
MPLNKLNIGIIIDPNNIETNGGAFSYYNTLISTIDKKKFSNKISIRFIDFDGKCAVKFNKTKIVIAPNFYNNILYWFNCIISKFLIKLSIRNAWLTKKINDYKVNQLIANKIDIIYYLTPFQNVLNFPYVITHWDLGHKSTYALPELVMNSSFEFRDKYHKEILNKAFSIFVESETSILELANFENISTLKMKVVPLFPSDVVKLDSNQINCKAILEKFSLISNDFFFYPAQYWSHKNHVTLLIAFKEFLKINGSTKLLFTGSDKGNYEYVVESALELGIYDSVIFAGFVTNEELFAFYKNCISLVMPTFLGPTNMPLIEAYELDCKIICSNLEGHKKMMGDHAFYVSPTSSNEIYNAMVAINDIIFPPRVKGIYSVENSVDKIEEAFLSILPIRKTFYYN